MSRPSSPDPDAPHVVLDEGPRRRRPTPPLTEAWLTEQALKHLQRFWPSVAQMRRVLMRRVDRALEHHGGSRQDGAAMVERVLARLVADKTLDDARFAEAWVRDLHRRGVSRRAIAARLREKGVDAALAQAALERLDGEVEDGELVRACAYARRRRLGAARPEARRPADGEARWQRREKDIAALCRAGFSFGVARKVVDAADLDALLEQADGGAGSTW